MFGLVKIRRNSNGDVDTTYREFNSLALARSEMKREFDTYISDPSCGGAGSYDDQEASVERITDTGKETVELYVACRREDEYDG